jgi:cellulose synthase/poly-beta-1,6-N-acetylglucosamine synthase-like glycosyltransferase
MLTLPRPARATGTSAAGRRHRPRVTAAVEATVTVVIPCHDYARYLPDAVGSALRQTGVTVRVLVVDDASTDDSVGVAQRLAEDDDRVRVLVNPANRGCVATFNRGLEEVDTDFLVRLDADDLLTPGSLGRAAALALAFPSTGLVYGRPVHFAGDVPARWRSRTASWTVWSGRDWLAARCRSGLNVITSPEVLMRTSVVREVGGQQPLEHAHDMEMWLRIAAFSDVGHVDGPDQAWHREHPASLSRAMTDVTGLQMLQERRRAFDTLFAGPAGRLPGAGALHADALLALCREALGSACHQYDRGRADPDAVDALTRYAQQTYDGCDQLREWGALRRRARLGRRLPSRLPWYVAQAARRRARLELARRRWLRWGVYSA